MKQLICVLVAALFVNLSLAQVDADDLISSIGISKKGKIAFTQKLGDNFESVKGKLLSKKTAYPLFYDEAERVFTLVWDETSEEYADVRFGTTDGKITGAEVNSHLNSAAQTTQVISKIEDIFNKLYEPSGEQVWQGSAKGGILKVELFDGRESGHSGGFTIVYEIIPG